MTHPDVLYSTANLPDLTIPVGASVRDALHAIERGRRRIAFVVSSEGRVAGAVTDGDVRRALLQGVGLDERVIDDVMTKRFVFVTPEAGRAEVLDLMRARSISQIPVLDDDEQLIGLHLLHEFLSPVERPNCAVILAGGKGTRLWPLTEDVPKPMIHVAGRPILERIVLHLVGAGIRRVFLSVNYLADVVRDHFGDGEMFGCAIEYLTEDQPLGTGGPLSLLPHPVHHDVLVMNGDLVTQVDVGRLLACHEQSAYYATIGVRPHEVTIPFGVIESDDGMLQEFREKPTDRVLVNAGVYVLSPEAVGDVPRGEEYPITRLFANGREHGRRIGVHLIEEEWTDVGRHDELRRARGEP